MGRVQKPTTKLGSPTRGHVVIRAALRNDSAPVNKPNKPNRKFQLALQGLNKQHNHTKARQEPKKEVKQVPRPAAQHESATRLSFTHGSRGLAQAEPSTISFTRNSPKPTPPVTPEDDSSKVSSRRPSGYRASPLGQMPSSQPSLSFVRGAKPVPETIRNFRENKDRPAVAANGLFMRNISDIGNQNACGRRATKPYDRPDSLKSNPKTTSHVKGSLVANIRAMLPPAATSTEATRPLIQGIKPRVGEPKPAVSILDRLGTAKRRRSPSPVNEAKREKLDPPPNRNSQIASRLGIKSRSEPQHSLPPTQSVRSRLGRNETNSGGYNNQGHGSQAFRPAPHHMPQQRRQEKHQEVHQDYLYPEYQHQEYYHEYSQSQGYQDYPAPMSQSHPQQPGYPVAPQQQQHVFPNNTYYPNLYMPRRCQYFPRCAREDCKFFHPIKDCPNDDECIDEGCLFVHPAEKKPIMCMFDATCNRVDCKFEHAFRRLAVGDPDRYLPIKCTGECVGRKCPFIHPNDKLPHENTLCIFAARCNRPPCSYVHLSTYRKKPAKKATSVTDLMAAYKSVMLDSEHSDDD